MKDRIKMIMESQHMTQQTFSQFLGISSAALSSVYNGRTKPTLNMVEAICQKIPGIRLQWLMFGTGSMLENEENSTPVQSTQKVQSLFPENDMTEPHKELKGVAKRKEDNNKKQESDRGQEIKGMKISDKSQRHITEIRVYFDDQTYETFVPDKS